MVKITTIIFVITLFLVILFLTHFYIYTKFIKIFPGYKLTLIILLSILAISFPLASILTRYSKHFLKSTFYFISATWLGILFFLIVGFAILDLLFLIFKIFSFQANYKTFLLIVISIVILISAYSIINAQTIKINKITINSEKIEKNLKVVQLSDIHLGIINSKSYMEKIVQKTNSLNPDLILITGDLFDGSSEISQSDIDSLNKLNSTYGVYFTTGNHEEYFGLNKSLELVKNENITILENRKIDISKTGIELIGISYPPDESQFSKTIPELDKMKLNNSKFTILMYHVPSGLNSTLNKKINLQLSGHLHKGQIFPFGLLHYFFFKYPNGFNKIGEESYLQVSDGTGTWGPPMRFLSRNEITEINLVKK